MVTEKDQLDKMNAEWNTVASAVDSQRNKLASVLDHLQKKGKAVELKAATAAALGVLKTKFKVGSLAPKKGTPPDFSAFTKKVMTELQEIDTKKAEFEKLRNILNTPIASDPVNTSDFKKETDVVALIKTELDAAGTLLGEFSNNLGDFLHLHLTLYTSKKAAMPPADQTKIEAQFQIYRGYISGEFTDLLAGFRKVVKTRDAHQTVLDAYKSAPNPSNADVSKERAPLGQALADLVTHLETLGKIIKPGDIEQLHKDITKE
jgi:hypothetical protein